MPCINFSVNLFSTSSCIILKDVFLVNNAEQDYVFFTHSEIFQLIEKLNLFIFIAISDIFGFTRVILFYIF